MIVNEAADGGGNGKPPSCNRVMHMHLVFQSTQVCCTARSCG